MHKPSTTTKLLKERMKINCRKRRINHEQGDMNIINCYGCINKKRHMNNTDYPNQKVKFTDNNNSSLIIKTETTTKPYQFKTSSINNYNTDKTHVVIPTFITCTEMVPNFITSPNSIIHIDALKKQYTQFLKNQNNHTYYNNDTVNQLIFPPLNEIYPKWLCGAYCTHGSDFIQKRDWIDSGFNKCLNLCTVSRDNFHPKIVTLKRYFTIENRKKINYCLNVFPPKFREKIEFDPTRSTYGIRVSGKTFGTRHNASINSFYHGPNNWNSKVQDNIEQKVTVTEYIIPNIKQVSPHSIIQQVTQNGLQTKDQKYVYLFGYHLDPVTLNIESVNSFNSANLLIQFRLKSPNKKEGSCSWEFRLIVDDEYFRKTQHYVKLIFGFICSSIYHSESLKYITFSMECWQTYFESDMKLCEKKNDDDNDDNNNNNSVKSILYHYINSTNSDILTMEQKAIATKHNCFIYIDQFEYNETRFKDYLDKRNITKENLLNKNLYPQVNRKLCDGEDDYFIQFPIDVIVWIIVLSNIANDNKKLISLCANNKIKAYLHMIGNHGVSHYKSSVNRIKNFDKATYIWGTGNSARNHPLGGIRLLKQGIVTEENLNLYYLSEINNLNQLENDTNFTMLASNLYHGPKGSFIDNHYEDYKFEGYIWTKPSGESSRLTIGAGCRALGSNALFTIPSIPGSYTGFLSNGLCMTIAPHGVRRAHLSWIHYDWRICDLLRFIKTSILHKVKKHVKKCSSIEDNKLLCDCFTTDSFCSYDDLPTLDSIKFKIDKKM